MQELGSAAPRLVVWMKGSMRLSMNGICCCSSFCWRLLLVCTWACLSVQCVAVLGSARSAKTPA